MAEQPQSGISHADFEALLSDALDRRLTGAQLQNFQAHLSSCADCGVLFAEAESGLAALKALQEANPPAGLLPNILVSTTGLHTGRAIKVAPARASWWEQFSASFLTPIFAGIRQPRFVMSFGMAFFSASICLSLAGIKVSDLRAADLRPSAIKRNYYEASGRVVKYYENIRLVYEFQARVREFKRLTASPEPAPSEQKNNERRNDTSGHPDLREEQNYSRGDENSVLAELPKPVLTVSIPRRFL